MAAKKTKKKGLLDEPLRIDPIESTFFLESLAMKRLRWSAKFGIHSVLPKTYHTYKMILEFNEEPYLDRIHDLEKDLDESLFKNEKVSKKQVAKKIRDIRNQISRLRKDCVKIEFTATVEGLKYKDSSTDLTIRIPDDVIDPLNKQKVRLDLYKINLVPIV